MRHHTHHRTVHAWRRVKTFRADKQDVVHCIAPLQHDRQTSVVRGAGLGHHPVDHFLLQHEVLVLHHGHMVKQMKQDRAGNVVGQVTHNAQLLSGLQQGGRQRGEVHLEHIRFHHVELRMFAQALGQIAVQLHHGQAAQTLHQGLCQGGQTRADFDHGVRGRGRNLAHDGIDDGAIGQEVLAEPFACDVFHCGLSRIST